MFRIAGGYEHLTAFQTHYGMFESLIVRDGLRNAPAEFQDFLNDANCKVLGRGVTMYVYNKLVCAETLAEPQRIPTRVLEIVWKSSLYLKALKCELERSSVVFLGSITSRDGVQADPEKVKAVSEIPRLTNVRQTRSFLGLVGYYCRFVSKFSAITSPLNAVTDKGHDFKWTKAQEKVFTKFKTRLREAPILRHYDPKARTIIQTDASFFGWGFIILQISAADSQEHPIAIELGHFKGAQLNYTVTKEEFLAIVEAFTRCRHMLRTCP